MPNPCFASCSSNARFRLLAYVDSTRWFVQMSTLGLVISLFAITTFVGSPSSVHHLQLDTGV